MIFFLVVMGILIGKATHFLDEDKICQQYQPYLENKDSIILEGRITNKEKKTNSYAIYLDHVQILINGETHLSPNLILISDHGKPSVGTIINVKGTVSYFMSQRNEGNFNEETYYHRRGYGYRVFVVSMKSKNQTLSFYWKMKEKLYKLSQRTADFFQENLPKEEAGIIKTMLLANKSTLEPKIKQNFRVCGVSHILAISGLHISVLGMALYQFVRKRGLSFFLSGGLSITLIGLFVLMVGTPAGTLRAAVMFGLLMIAQWLGRTYDAPSAMSLAGTLILLENPYLLFEGGFLFSFAAVAGTLIMNAYLKENYKRMHWLWKTLIISIGIQSMTLPLTAYFYYELPLWVIPMNLLIVPFTGIILILGLVAGVAGCYFPMAASYILKPEYVILRAVNLLTEAVGKGKSTYVCGKPEIWVLIAYYALLAGVFLFLFRKKQVRILGFLPMLFVLLLFRRGEPFTVTMLDVGQGDGIYITTKEKVRIFIDGGSTDIDKVGEYRILPFLKSKGIGNIDYWFLSHLDEDHWSGLKDVLELRYPIGHLVVSKDIVKDSAYDSFLQMSKKAGIPIIYMKPEEVLSTESIWIQCANLRNKPEEERNARSLILYIRNVKEGFSGIFGGDIPDQVEKEWIAEYKIEPLTLYKVNHHGSNTSSCEAFLEAVSPQISAISSGRDNSYGHPSKECIRRLKEVQSAIYNTQQVGQITLTMKKDHVTLKTFCAESLKNP
ncbi:MAG: DNA internalization-related competence protein ComEC/Rec2 [Lachnospiraceae bacterium]